MSKRKMRIMLEYSCYPLWVYEENGYASNPMLPEELVGHTEIETLLSEIETTYNNLFIDTPKVFEYIGFDTHEEELEFLEKIHCVYQLIQEAVGDQYIITQEVELQHIAK